MSRLYPHPPCPHLDFKATVSVARITDVQKFVADIEVRCAACNVRFAFVGVPGGFSYEGPHVSPDGFELRAPIEPDGHMTTMMAEVQQPAIRGYTMPRVDGR